MLACKISFSEYDLLSQIMLDAGSNFISEKKLKNSAKS